MALISDPLITESFMMKVTLCDSRVTGVFQSQKVVDKVIQNKFKVITTNSGPQKISNIVWMSKEDYRQFFPDSEKDEIKFLSLGDNSVDKVYQVAILKWLEKGFIGLNPVQREEIGNGIFSLKLQEPVVASAFRLEEQNVVLLNKTIFKLEIWKRYRNLTMSNVRLNLTKLRAAFNRTLQSQVLTYNQSFFIKIGELVLKVGVARMSFPKKGHRLDELEVEARDYGMISNETVLDFIVPPNAGITRVDKIVVERANEFQFKVTPIPSISLSEKGIVKTPFPLPVDYFTLVEKVATAMLGKNLLIGEKIELRHPGGWNLVVELTSVESKVPLPTKVESQYGVLYQFLHGQPMSITSTSDELALTSGRIREIEKVVFHVNFHTGSTQDAELTSHRKSWLSEMELVEQIRKLRVLFFQSQKFHILLASGEYEIEVRKVETSVKDSAEPTINGVKELWILSEESMIEIKVDPALELTPVRSGIGYPLKKLMLKAVPVNPHLYDFNEHSILSKKLVMEHLKEYLKKKLVRSQSVEIDLGFASQLRIYIENMEFIGELPKTSLEHCGKVQNDTEICFVNDENSKVKIFTPNQQIKIDDPAKLLEEMGIGGLSSQMEEIVKEILLFHGPLRPLAEKRGLIPGKGILFSGIPGTGKTAFARCLAKMLGVLGETVIYFSGPEVFDKWVGSSEGNVRKLFAAARMTFKKMGKESPLFVVIIDEIDAMLGTRNGNDSSPVRASVVNQFLTEMDGLSPLPNILVIGMTNRKELLDPAVLRPGRFDVQLEIPVPKAEGRKKIFEIHAKILIGANLIAKDVDFKHFANETPEWTGAEIEAVVKKANRLAFARLDKIKQPIEVLERHSDGVVTKEDFSKALEKLKELKSSGVDISKAMIYL